MREDSRTFQPGLHAHDGAELSVIQLGESLGREVVLQSVPADSLLYDYYDSHFIISSHLNPISIDFV